MITFTAKKTETVKGFKTTTTITTEDPSIAKRLIDDGSQSKSTKKDDSIKAKVKPVKKKTTVKALPKPKTTTKKDKASNVKKSKSKTISKKTKPAATKKTKVSKKVKSTKDTKKTDSKSKNKVRLKLTPSEANIFKDFELAYKNKCVNSHIIYDFNVNRPKSPDFWKGLSMMGEVIKNNMQYGVKFRRN